MLEDIATRVNRGDLSEFLPLEAYDLTPDMVDRIHARLEAFQARHAVIALLATISGAVSLVTAVVMVFGGNPSAVIAAVTVLVAAIGVVAYSFPLSNTSAQYWKRRPDEFEILRFYERWHHQRELYVAKVTAQRAAQARNESLQRQKLADEVAQAERVEQSMRSIDLQFQDSFAAREERLKLVPVEPIRNARVLSELLAGIDDDVKVAFARLSPSSLCALMIDYEAAYGESARRYAERSWRQWSLGEVQMSAEVAQRLLALVPKFMTLDERFEIVKKLRDKYRPERVHRRIVCRSNELRQAVLPAVAELVDRSSLVAFPQSLVDRIEWILDSDVAATHKLLSAVETEEAERRVAHLEAEFQNIDDMIRRMPGKGAFTHRIDLPQGSITVVISRPRPDLLKLAKRLVS